MLHQIGTGTLGPVFRTYEPSRDRLVAVKVFRLDIVPEQAQALARALDRAAHASLSHPSIVEPIAAGLEGTVAYRAEDYVAAESLDVAMRHYAPAPIERVLAFITQLAGAIDFARAAGIGHGGLHPRDIFVTPDEARAAGFGVVDALEQVGIRAPIRRPYSAPERIAGSAWSTPADVFSLAAITFELLSGKRPSGTGSEIGAIPDGPHAAAVHDVLARAMDDEAARRYASALAFAGALEAASEGRPITDSTVVAVAAIPEPTRPAPEQPAAPEATVVIPAPADDDLTLEAPPPGEAASLSPFRAEATPASLAGDARLDAAEDATDDLTVPHEHDAEPMPVPGSLFDGPDGRAGERFAAEFADRPRTEPQRPTLAEADASSDETVPSFDSAEASDEGRRPHAVERAMFGAATDPDRHDPADHGRPAILPYAVVAVPMLLIGFAGGYFVGSRDRIAAPDSAQSTSASAPSAAAAPPADTARPYSDQKVTTPAAQDRPGTTEAETKPPATKPPVAAPASSASAASGKAPAAQRGQILVRSLPTHAHVTVNGTWKGRTPLTLDNLAFGNYMVRVVQPGYEVAREEFTLSAHAPTRTVTVRLERAQPQAAAPAARPAPPEAAFTGSLFINSRPSGATVLLDGKSVGQTPVSVPDVPVGSHVVRIEMDGKKPVSANPRITAGKTERITVSLEDKSDASAASGGAAPGARRRGESDADGASLLRTSRSAEAVRAGEGRR